MRTVRECRSVRGKNVEQKRDVHSSGQRVISHVRICQPKDGMEFLLGCTEWGAGGGGWGVGLCRLSVWDVLVVGRKKRVRD